MNFCCFLFLQNPRKLQVVLLYDLDFTMIMKMQFRTDPWVVIQMLA